jgi:hypothetical protein
MARSHLPEECDVLVEGTTYGMMGKPAVFISHASVDTALAAAVVHLIEVRTKLTEDLIRCTSLDGYRFEAGVEFNEALRREVFDAAALVALLTPHSLSSTYVLFELGARWGARKDLMPLLGCGATAVLVKGPLTGLNVLDLAQRGQTITFIEQLAKTVGRENERYVMPKYDDAISAVVAAAKNVAAHPAAAVAPPTNSNEKALRKMRAVLKGAGSTGQYVSNLATLAGVSQEDAITLLQNEPDIGFEGGRGVLRARLIKLD